MRYIKQTMKPILVRLKQSAQTPAVLALALLLLLSCSSKTVVSEFSDSTGERFSLKCSSKKCMVVRVAQTDECGTRASLKSGEFLTVCTGEEAVLPGNCRAVTCNSDTDCYNANDFSISYGCVDNRCKRAPQESLGKFENADAYAVCLENVARSAFCQETNTVIPDGGLPEAEADPTLAKVPSILDAVKAECPSSCAKIPAVCAE